MKRMYSVLHVKSVEDEERVIRGVATTPAVDRVGDIVDPMGVLFKNPMPLLHQHDSEKPVGTVAFDQPTKQGITFEARLPRIAEPGALRDRVETAWGEIKAGLVRAVSIGFRVMEDGIERLENGGLHFLKTEVMELSLVTIPANQEATITVVKSIDSALLASSGEGDASRTDEDRTSRASGKTVVKSIPKGIPRMTKKKTISEQVSDFEATRQAKAARMVEIMEDSGAEGVTLDAEQEEEYDGLADEVKSIDAHLKRLRDLEKQSLKTAKAVDGSDVANGAASRSSSVRISARGQRLEPGIAFTRIAKVKALAKLDSESVRDVARDLYGEDSPVYGHFVKDATGAANTTSSSWAGSLVGDETSAFADFVEYLRPMTIVGKFGTNGVPSLRRVPFRTALVGQDSGGEGYWVGEGAAKPLTRFDFSRRTLEPLKVANIAVATMELLRDSSPSAEMILRDQLAAALRARIDTDFIDPTKAVSAGVSPASITNGVVALDSTGTDADAVRQDIRNLFAAFIAANNAPTSGVWIMNATTALTLSLMVNPLGQLEFPTINMNGGTFFGLPVVTSEFVPVEHTSPIDTNYVILVNASDIYFADDGGVSVDMSQEASLEMSSTPAHASSGINSPASSQGASLVSLWQTNSVGFRAERTLNWMRRRDSAVQVLGSVAWTLQSS